MVRLLLNSILIICFLFLPSIVSATTTIPDSIVVNGKTLTINDTERKSNRLVYGTYKDVPGNNIHPTEKSQWRYLGYDLLGQKYSNPEYPPDYDATKSVKKAWIRHPWTIRLCPEPDPEIYQQDINLLKKVVNTYNGVTVENGGWEMNNGPWPAETLYHYSYIQQRPANMYTQGQIVLYNTGVIK